MCASYTNLFKFYSLRILRVVTIFIFRSGHPWEDSLYGKSVRQIDTVKPPQFDMEMEQAWREKLLAAKSGEKAKKMMQQRSQENLSDGEN